MTRRPPRRARMVAQTLQSVPGPLLRRLLEGFEPFLDARVADIAGAFDERAGRRRLGLALGMVPKDLPPELYGRLATLAILARPRAADIVRRVATEAGVRVARKRESDAAFAVRVMLDAPDLCRIALARVRADRAAGFREFVGVPDPYFSQTIAKDKARALEQARASAGCSRVCIVPMGGRFLFEVYDSAGGADPAAQLMYDPRDGRLLVRARDSPERDELRRAFGGVFYGDPERFIQRRIVCLWPLTAYGLRTLPRAGPPALRALRLRYVTFQPHRGTRHVERAMRGELMDAAERRLRREVPRVAAFDLHLKLRDTERIARVTLTEPGGVAFPRDDEEVERVVCQYLFLSGLVHEIACAHLDCSLFRCGGSDDVESVLSSD